MFFPGQKIMNELTENIRNEIYNLIYIIRL